MKNLQTPEHTTLYIEVFRHRMGFLLQEKDPSESTEDSLRVMKNT